jgi:hypothetical protein
MQKPFFGGLILVGLVFAVFTETIFAASKPRLYLDPATDDIKSGSQFTLKLSIDAGTQAVVAADAKVSFPKAKLEVVSVKVGTYFDSITKIIGNQTGNLEIHAYNKVQGETNTGSGDLATITFKSLSPGQAIVDLTCTAGSTVDSNIADVSGNDLIDCLQTAGSEISILQAGVEGIATPTPTPSKLPKAGNMNPSLMLLAVGSLSLILGFSALAFQKETI